MLLENNQLKAAEKAFLNVLTMNREHVQTLTNMGVIALKKEQGQLAIDYFTKALALDNHHTEARNNLAATFIHHDRFENALTHYAVLLEQEPNNIEYLYNAGVAQMALGHLKEATHHFELILKQQNDHFSALNNLAAIQTRLGKRDEATALLERALLANPHDEATQFMLNALTRDNKNPKACSTYVHNLFNNYALYYDQHMQGALSYTLPQHMARLLHSLNLDQAKKAVDLGCGTGLCGNVLRKVSAHLTGVDISTKMLEQARHKTIYDQLIDEELISFLQHDKSNYDLMLAADVLPYLGELDTFFLEISTHLTPGGYYLFSHEISPTRPWQLQNSARFSHHPDYIRQLCQQFKLKIIKQETVVGRQQNEESLDVMIYVVQK